MNGPATAPDLMEIAGRETRYIARCSYGNDSIAMLQLLREHGLKHVAVAYSDTKWASEDWERRVTEAEAWVKSLGWTAYRIDSKGFEAGTLGHSQTGMFPTRIRKWCTRELKILPFLKWAKEFDPEKRCIVCVGVRRAESDARINTPVFIPEKDNGRHVWHPLAEFSDAARDAMILKTPFPVLDHRSDECEMCINNNRPDFLRMTERAISRVELLEQATGQPMFHPSNHMGATGIREVIRWAKSERGKFRPAGWKPDMPLLDPLPDPGVTCDDDWCGR